jgi:hypothetical protein
VADADDLRVSDEQRDRAAQEIREHYAAGRLTDDELSDRVQAAYTARTEQELRRLLSDLPKLPASPSQQKAELAARRSARCSSGCSWNASSTPAGASTSSAAGCAATRTATPCGMRSGRRATALAARAGTAVMCEAGAERCYLEGR